LNGTAPTPNRFQAFAAVNPPAAGASAREALERALDAGLIGVCELCPQAQDGDLNDQDWSRVFALATAGGVPVNLHVTDPHSITPGSCKKPTPIPP
jgi:predicted TIM-barrel fold metal-dependent hydrolase